MTDDNSGHRRQAVDLDRQDWTPLEKARRFGRRAVRAVERAPGRCGEWLATRHVPLWLEALGTVLAALAIMAAFIGIVVGLVWLIKIVLTALVHALIILPARTLWSWLAHWPVAAVITQPVHTYLVGHAAGLPASPSLLGQVWGWSALGLLTAAWLFRSWGARLGWVVFGAATAAMVWLGSPEPGRWIAVVLTALAWSMLSTLAFKGVGVSMLLLRSRDTIINNSIPPCGCARDRQPSRFDPEED